MRNSATTMAMDHLLAHAGWTRRLAHRLIHDDATADDASQDAFVAALRATPASDRSLRPWLGRVLRNVASNRRRDDGRRRMREAVAGAAFESPVETPEELVERAELQGM